MGSGASTDCEAKDKWEDKPVNFSGGGVKLANGMPAQGTNKSLEAQATANWNRMMNHSKEMGDIRKVQDQESSLDNYDPSADIMHRLKDKNRKHHEADNITKQAMAYIEEEEANALAEKEHKKKKAKPKPKDSGYVNTLMQNEKDQWNSEPTASKPVSVVPTVASSTMERQKNTSVCPFKHTIGLSAGVIEENHLITRNNEVIVPIDWKDIEYKGKVDLPGVICALKSRTGSSISLVWDIDTAALELLPLVRLKKNPKEIVDPVYSVQYRLSSTTLFNAVRFGVIDADKVEGVEDVLRAKWRSGRTRVKGTSATIENLAPNTLYDFRVCRLNWDKQWGPAISFVRSGPSTPSCVVNVQAKEVTSSSILITWAAPERDNGLPITGYGVRILPLRMQNTSMLDQPDETSEDIFFDIKDYLTGDDYDTKGSLVGANTQSNPNAHVWKECFKGKDRVAMISKLNPFTLYAIQVYAINMLGAGDYSSAIGIRTLDQNSTGITPWVCAIDPASNRMYYYHPASSTSAWDLPSYTGNSILIDLVESFKNKKNHFLKLAAQKSSSICKERNIFSHILKFTGVRRTEAMYHQGFELLMEKAKNSSWELLAGPIRINYDGEDGIDAGGLAKDWFVATMKSLVRKHIPNKNDTVKASLGILHEDESGFVSVNPTAPVIYSDDECRYMYEALGLFLGKSLVDGQTVGVKFNPLLLAALLEYQVDTSKSSSSAGANSLAAQINCFNCAKEASLQFKLSDLQESEPEFYRGLQWVQDNDVTDADITYSTSYEVYSFNSKTNTCSVTQKEVDLIPNGANVNVTEEDKQQYIALMLNWLCRKRYEPVISYILKGFRRCVSYAYLQHFNVSELQQLLGGAGVIDVKEINKEVQYSGGVEEGSDEVKWLFEVLEELTQAQLSTFLTFVTGCSVMPVDGLNPRLLITRYSLDSGYGNVDDVLPRAHTCFNQLVLPAYKSCNALKTKLLFALENMSSEFTMS